MLTIFSFLSISFTLGAKIAACYQLLLLLVVVLFTCSWLLGTTTPLFCCSLGLSKVLSYYCYYYCDYNYYYYPIYYSLFLNGIFCKHYYCVSNSTAVILFYYDSTASSQIKGSSGAEITTLFWGWDGGCWYGGVKS